VSPRDAAALLGWTALHGAWAAAAVAIVAALLLRALDARAAAWRYRAASAGVAAAALLPLAIVALALWGAGDAGGGAAAANASASPSFAAGEAAARLLPWIGGAWMAGVLMGAARLAAGWGETRRLRREDVHPPPASWMDALDRAALRTGMRAGLRVSARVDAPLVAGIRRPMILLPRAVPHALDARQAEAVLVHELVHVRRRDALVNLLHLCVDALYLHHPAVRWLCTQARREREHCCDAAVVALGTDAVVYARALATLEQLRPARPLALAAADGELLDRVRRLVHPAPGRHPRPVPTIGAAVAGALCIAGVAAEAADRSRPLLRAAAPPRMLVTASDPAGDFTLEVRGGRVVAASVAGVPVARGRLVQVRDSVTLLSDGGQPRLSVRLLPDGIRWIARSPSP
jgi:beta-lactamase regulating signal transducer with metallopeptidase domain